MNLVSLSHRVPRVSLVNSVRDSLVRVSPAKVSAVATATASVATATARVTVVAKTRSSRCRV